MNGGLLGALTWLGISRLSLGNRMQFRHILLTRSSLMMTISWLQYWILTEGECTSFVLFSRQTRSGWFIHLFSFLSIYLQGLVVNTEKGTLCLKSSVMCSASGGLGNKRSHVTNDQMTNINLQCSPSPTLAGWCRVPGLRGRERKQSDFCWRRRKDSIMESSSMITTAVITMVLEPTH